jgi:hypothetical protein
MPVLPFCTEALGMTVNFWKKQCPKSSKWTVFEAVRAGLLEWYASECRTWHDPCARNSCILLQHSVRMHQHHTRPTTKVFVIPVKKRMTALKLAPQVGAWLSLCDLLLMLPRLHIVIMKFPFSVFHPGLL